MNFRLLLLIFLIAISGIATAQNNDIKKQLNDIFSRIPGNENKDSLTKEAIREIFSTDVLDNDVVLKGLQHLLSDKSGAYNFMRDLNFKPKTFQTDSGGASLGFEYKYDNSWSKVKKTAKSLFIQDYSLSFNGNVAFKKKLNPNNFLESSFSYNGAFNWGGQPLDIDDATSDKIEELEDSILARRARKEPYMDLYKKVNSFITVSDQFYLGIKGKFTFESNQDFSKTQFAPGILLGFGAKGWNKNEALRHLNILDYPFAFIRLLTGTDDEFTVYGATFPSFLFGLDYVVPEKDSIRKALTGNEDPYSRLRFEIAFKTRVARIGKDVFNFSSNFRWYKELNASDAIKSNNLASSRFFVAAIESATGLFVSYTTGKLPFDRKNDQVYALGFKYDLGNTKDK
ncbi:MAG TPA: hypothetical protein VF487_07135 [Chitinophagaceae bacterium]